MQDVLEHPERKNVSLLACTFGIDLDMINCTLFIFFLLLISSDVPSTKLSEIKGDEFHDKPTNALTHTDF